MAFFWSSPSSNLAGIFKRSARYWITTYVGNCLWGPPGHRGVRNPNHPGHAEWKRANAQRELAQWDALPATTKAARLRRESHDMAARLGWSETERRAQEAAMLWSEGVSAPVGGGHPTRGAAAISRSGGLRGGARPWGRQPSKRGAAVSRSGGLRGGAASRWAHR